MKNIAVIVGLLFGAFGVALLCGAGATTAGRIGVASVFGFAAIGHFVKTDQMAAMLPTAVPAQRAVILLSGAFEAFLAVLVLFSSYAKIAGVTLCIFLVLITPVNIYAAMRKVAFGGHSAGPRYLWVRLPLQIVLILWTYWFAVRRA